MPPAQYGDLANVPYNAMLRQLDAAELRPDQASAAAAFVGSVVLLVVVYFGHRRQGSGYAGFLQLPVGDGMNVGLRC